ncbi:multisubstrate pseudouridine synthase 7 [[Candida] jaroonii]|uniref:Multisubstrate pseudouridine synthase 7 n=1 Tax=[Candida] jaroonii TaxID=467808 RepID=A0ACA9YB72_9ASCO|nr:multisubstrate pseudouridine synthase 7 [[Candida] jaroonii]
MESVKRIGESPEPQDVKRVRLSDEERALKLIKESDVGIIQFLNDKSAGFSGMLKQRYSDFMVNEIDLKGNVVHLLDEGVDAGKTRKEKKIERRQKERQEFQGKTSEEIQQIKEERKIEAMNQPKYELTEENRKALLELITEKELQNIEDLFVNGKYTETETKFEDKSTRGKLHQLLRESFEGKLETITSPENTFRITIAKNPSTQRGRHPQESLNHVDENGVINFGIGPFKHYLHFTVYKENRETMEVAGTLAKFLRIPSKNIRYAGTKDRRGITCQRFAIHKGKLVRVSTLNKALKNVVLGGFSYEDENLSLGSLKGNEFLITIRNVKAINEGDDLIKIITTGFETLKTKGFINYYGMQRFGTFSISTHTLGVKLLNDDWKGFVDLLLAEQDVVDPGSEESRKIWSETSNPSFALKKMPRRCVAENSVLKRLCSEPLSDNEDYSSHSYFQSIMAIPRNLRIMYAHAYQSYIWNIVASQRINKYGLDVIEGDLVLVEVEEKKEIVDGEVFEEDSIANKYIRAKPLTKEDVESGEYSIYDVVLPMPGFDIVYPGNESIKQIYVDEMAKDGLDPFKMARRVREFSLAGSYRNIMSKPGNVDYKIIKYQDDDQPLVRSDLEILRAKQEGKDLDRFIQSEDGDKTAVVLRLQLGVSSYATMALREFMKADTARFGDTLKVAEN